MNNPITTKTVKTFDTLRNSKGGYSEKNETLVNIAKKCIELKHIGDNFILNMEFGKDGYYTARDGKNYSCHDKSKYLKLTDIVNFITCLSLTMEDRAFLLSYNKSNQIMITCLSIEKLDKNIMVRDKNAMTNSNIEVNSVFDASVKMEVTEKTSKGIRPIDDTEISQLKTAFNSMLGKNYNKALFEKVEKRA